MWIAKYQQTVSMTLVVAASPPGRKEEVKRLDAKRLMSERLCVAHGRAERRQM
jgi:hypothetical protein